MKHLHEPLWQPLSRLRQMQIPRQVRCWLQDPASLTKRMQHACDATFSVRVLRQQWARPMCNESQTLQMPDGQRGTLREVQLLCGGVPWVFARTIIPYKTQTGRERRLAHLGNRPLGAVLFADKTMRRGPVEVACLQKGDAMYDQATRSLSPRPASIWGRRSVFYLHDKPLLVSEVFLPRIIRCNCR